MNKRRCGGRLAALFGAAVLALSMLTGCTEVIADTADSYTPTDRFFVNDFADVLNDEVENQIYAQGVALQQKTDAQVVVVTVESMDGESIEDFAYDLANGWGIGEAEKDSGILLLFALEEREVRIEVGSGLEGQLTDSKTGRMIDTYAIPYFEEDDFSTGIKNTYAAIVNEVYYEFGLETPEDYVPADRLPDTEKSTVPLWVVIPIGLVFVVFVIRHPYLALAMLRSTRFYGGGGHGGRGGGGFSGGGGGFSGGGSSRGF